MILLFAQFNFFILSLDEFYKIASFAKDVKIMLLVSTLILVSTFSIGLRFYRGRYESNGLTSSLLFM